MKYMIDEATTAARLAESVNEKLALGWQPAGGLMIAFNAEMNVHVFYQALTRE